MKRKEVGEDEKKWLDPDHYILDGILYVVDIRGGQTPLIKIEELPKKVAK